MALVQSTMLPLGTKAPDFALPDAANDGAIVSLADVSAGRAATLVIFLCNHCPYVKHVADELARLARDYMAKGVGVVGINSNNAEKYPDDSPDKMRDEAEARGYPFPYLVDADQSAAKAYRAACTPDFFLFDRDLRLAYRGRLDASRPGNMVPVDGADLRAALNAVLCGESVPEPHRPSGGCNIKWRPGQEPEWWGK